MNRSLSQVDMGEGAVSFVEQDRPGGHLDMRDICTVAVEHWLRQLTARVGIQKHFGWHSFLHTFSTTLIENGENVKVVQELMRHSNCRCTLDSIRKRKLGQRGTHSNA